MGMMRNSIKRFKCLVVGHISDPTLIEVWLAQKGLKKSYFLCRRCYHPLGEKHYERRT